MTMAAIPPTEQPLALRLAAVVDDGEFANLMDAGRFGHLQRVATLFASSQLVPSHFQNNAANCFIAMQMAMRMHVDPFMFMQNCYIVHGRPGLEAKLAIALVNSSGLFTDGLDYELRGGPDPMNPDYAARAWTTRKGASKPTQGPWITWDLVKAEKWDQPKGSAVSKWLTMPEIMFQYRAAMFFARLHCPERLMGMQTIDELDDIAPPRQVDSVVVDTAKTFSKTRRLAEKFGAEPSVNQSTGEVIPAADPDSQLDPAADASHETQIDTGAPPTRQEPPAPAQEKAGAGEGATPVMTDDEANALLESKSPSAKKPAADYSHVTTWEQFVSGMDEIGQDFEVMPAIVSSCINKLAVRKGWKGKNAKDADPKFLRECLIGAKAGKWDWKEAVVTE